MVRTNNAMIDINLINKYINKEITNSLDNNLYWFDKDGKNIITEKQKNIITKNIIKEINMKNIIEESIDYNYCTHKYKNGKNIGKYCMSKIRVKANDNKNKYLCSRHCRNYEPNGRNYVKKDRCLYVRNNGIQCKHFSNNKANYCYIHYKYEKDKEKEFIFNYGFILKLKKLRKLYLLKKHKKIKRNNLKIYYSNNFNKSRNLFFNNTNNNIFYEYIKELENIKHSNSSSLWSNKIICDK